MTDKKLSALSAGTAIADADLFYSAQGGGQVKQPASALRTYLLGGSGIRTLLTSTLNLYIDPAGSDTTGNGSIGNPWQSIQHASDYVASSIDLGGQSVIINMANGTYAAATFGGTIPGSTAGGIALSTNGAVTLTGSGFAVLYVFFGSLYLVGTGTFTFTNTNSGNTDLFADISGYIQVNPSVTLQFTAGATDTIHCYAQNGGSMVIYANRSITGNFGCHFQCVNSGIIQLPTSIVTTFISSPTVGTAFAVADTTGNIAFATGQTFTGTLTGKKYQSTMGGAIQTFGQTLPGTVGGTTGTFPTGGFYA